MKKNLMVLAVFVLVGCGESKVKTTEVAQTASVQEPATLVEAINAYKPSMSDITHASSDEYSEGVLSLARWSAGHLQWAELNSLPTGSFALTMKDPNTQRGKKICMSGIALQIAATPIDDVELHESIISSDAGDIYSLLAVKSIGEVVANRKAAMCGVITGTRSYRTSGNGITHSLQLVGMFDLPENTVIKKK